MIQTVRVKTIIGSDLLGQGVFANIKHTFPKTLVTGVVTCRVFRLEGATIDQAKLLSEKLLAEPINQTYTINKPILKDVDQVIEIAYKPGVMNPEVASIIKIADDLGISLTTADASIEYGFFGKLTKKDAQDLVTKLRLFNPLIEHIVTTQPQTLLISGTVGPTTRINIREMTDNALIELSKDKLFLSLEELKIIQAYFQKIKRDPTDCELETLAQTWSEHCAHKTFKAKLIVDGKQKEPLMTRLKKQALQHKKNIVSAFVDNSGVMDFYDGYAINGKAETHNSPSAIEPYGGAMTGSGGVFRDVVGTGLGAKAIASTDIFCFAPPDLPKDQLPDGCLPPDYILKRCVTAVKDYGNRVGIPTNNGSFHFHKDFRAKPTVLVGAYGILPKKDAQKGSPKKGDQVLVIGGKTGRDGIHGATFSSGEMTHRTINVNATAVQIGNAIEEKRTFDVILEARDKGLIRAMQDCGAGGFSSAIGEMGENLGVSVDLSLAPVKYPGLCPWEIWVSESQERMALAIPKEKVNQFLDICKKYNVTAANLGYFDGSKKLNVYYGKEKVCELDMQFIYNGLPQRTMIARRSAGDASPLISEVARKGLLRGGLTSEQDWIGTLKKILSHGNICSKEPIVRMYDHNVQGTNAMHPYGGVGFNAPNDAAVVKPLLNKPYGVIISHGLNPILNTFDPYWGSIWAATEAIANYVSVGGDYKNATLINNYIWPFPDEESLWSLDQSVTAVCDFMKTLQIPVISGKDSLSSTYRGKDGSVIKIPPTLCISVFGKIPDVTKTVSTDFKKVDSTIVLVGKMDFPAMAGSVYHDIILGSPDSIGTTPESSIPHIYLKILPQTLDAIHNGIQRGEILACHDISEGGLGTTIFEMCLGGGIGANLSASQHLRGDPQDPSEVDALAKHPDQFLFNETAGCFIVEVENEEIAKQLFKNVPHAIIGKTKKELTISPENLPSISIETLKNAWQKPMKEIFSQ